MPRNADELVDLLDLEMIDDTIFRGRQMPSTMPRVFGGQAAAQSLSAAARTVDPEFVVHSLHSYFLQPGDTRAPTIFEVEQLRQSRSFATRRVLARQHGRPIYALTADFQRVEEGLSHQDVMPDVPGPDDAEAVTLGTRRLDRDRDTSTDQEWDVVDLRHVGSSADDRLPAEAGRAARQCVWMRVSSPLPDDPFQHAAAFTYLSDMTLTWVALAPHGIAPGTPGLMLASLDHSVWFHAPFRADEWWLYDQVSPVARGGRALVSARVFSRDGTLVATVTQEALMRYRSPAEETEDPDGSRDG